MRMTIGERIKIMRESERLTSLPDTAKMLGLNVMLCGDMKAVKLSLMLK